MSILETLTSAGYAAYYVGGYVRDTLLGLAPIDRDVATSATPEEVLALFPHAKPMPRAPRAGTSPASPRGRPSRRMRRGGTSR